MSAAEKVALVVAAVIGGSLIGLLGATLLARRHRSPAEPPTRAAAPIAPMPPPTAPFPPPPVALHVYDVKDPELDGARERHRELYDAEFLAQVDRLERLRRRIGKRLEPDRWSAFEEPDQ